MPSTRTHDIYATVGRYKHDGRRMKRSIFIGSGFTDREGRLYLRLDAVPVSQEWSGWLTLHPVRRPTDEPLPELPPEDSVKCDELFAFPDLP